MNAAAVGLVTDAWREGLLNEIRMAGGGPSDGDNFAQSADLYRRARGARGAGDRPNRWARGAGRIRRGRLEPGPPLDRWDAVRAGGDVRAIA